MKWLLYDALFALTFPFLLPGFLVRMLRRGGYAARMGDRFALYPEDVLRVFRPSDLRAGAGRLDASGHPVPAKSEFVWIHAVSVGEVQVAGQLMREWRKVEPSVRFCFSTTSSTGWTMAKKELASLPPRPSAADGDVLVYNPLDFPNFVASALKTVRPRAIVLTESEIWPVFIRKAHRHGVPLFLINARVSDRSAPRYARAKWFFRDVFGCFTRIFAQSDLDRERLLAAGAPADRVVVSGSFKFDVAHRNPAKEAELRAWTGPGRILLGGSTWPGEDQVLLDAYRDLLRTTPPDEPPPLLVLAPRHFEKADAVEANIRKAGFACVRRSRGETARGPRIPQPPVTPVFLADTTGELMGLYGIADVVFVGKSLCAHGSQNMIEPCLCGKPTLVGPYTENFRPVMSDLLAGAGLLQVPDAASLKAGIRRLFADAPAAAELGRRAAAVVERRLGVVPKCVSDIRERILP